MRRRRSSLPKALLGGFCIVFVVTFYKLLYGSGFGREDDVDAARLTHEIYIQPKAFQPIAPTTVETGNGDDATRSTHQIHIQPKAFHPVAPTTGFGTWNDDDATRLTHQIHIQPKPFQPVAPTTGFEIRVGDVATRSRHQIHIQPKTFKPVPVLVIACNRPSVKRCLNLLLKTRPSSETFPIIVSQDCGHQETSNVIKSYGDSVKYIQQPDLSEPNAPPNMMHLLGYYKLSKHYKWALTQVFNVLKYDTVIIVEDDLEIAPDFFEYFSATLPLLHTDPALWCISAWNDNGKDGYVRGSDILYRSDFFPGLGWALTKSTWDEIGPKWPDAFWDDWMRHPDQRKGRACIRPEISRTKTFGRIGVSNGQFFDRHLSKIQLNQKFYPFMEKDMSYLTENNYDQMFKAEVYKSKLVSVNDVIDKKVDKDTVHIEYRTNNDFITIANRFDLMSDLKAGVPRMAYLGIVSFFHEPYRVYLAPVKDWTGYKND